MSYCVFCKRDSGVLCRRILFYMPMGSRGQSIGFLLGSVEYCFLWLFVWIGVFYEEVISAIL